MNSEDQARREALARERETIEQAISVIAVYRQRMSEGQINELKRIIYNVPRPQ